MKKHTLVICFDRFRDPSALTYIEIVSESCDDHEVLELKRRPRAARFDEVLETGEGSYTHWNAHRATKLYRHELLKT
jgi:hypothetical protein